MTVAIDAGSWVGTIVGLLPLVVFGGVLVLMRFGRHRQNGPQNTPDMYDQLKQIADLKDRGALTEREFEVEKRKILGGD
jgi:hypothetical protein